QPAAFGYDLTLHSFSSFVGQTNIVLQASGTVMIGGGSLSLPPLPPGATSGQLVVQAGDNVVIEDNTCLSAGPGWSVCLLARGKISNHGTVSTPGGSIVFRAG